MEYRVKYIARFYCGCIYEIGFDMLPMICPVHRSILTGIEKIRSGMNDKITIRKLATYDGSRVPLRLDNSKYGSLSKIEMVVGDGFEDELDSEYGLCDACYIEYGSITPTYIPYCGCRNSECKYRWCGRTDGLHAFFKMHVNKSYGKIAEDYLVGRYNPQSEDAYYYFDRDIFARGPAKETPNDWQEALNSERDDIKKAVEKLKVELLNSDSYFINNLSWLIKNKYMAIERKLTWLYCTGVLAPQEDYVTV